MINVIKSIKNSSKKITKPYMANDQISHSIIKVYKRKSTPFVYTMQEKDFMSVTSILSEVFNNPHSSKKECS